MKTHAEFLEELKEGLEFKRRFYSDKEIRWTCNDILRQIEQFESQLGENNDNT